MSPLFLDHLCSTPGRTRSSQVKCCQKLKEVICSDQTVDLDSAERFLNTHKQVTLLEIKNLDKVLCHMIRDKVDILPWRRRVTAKSALSVENQNLGLRILNNEERHLQLKHVKYGRCTFNFGDASDFAEGDPNAVWPFGTVLTLLCPFLTTVDIGVSIALGEPCWLELALLSNLEHLENLSMMQMCIQQVTDQMINLCCRWYVYSLLC